MMVEGILQHTTALQRLFLSCLYTTEFTESWLGLKRSNLACHERGKSSRAEAPVGVALGRGKNVAAKTRHGKSWTQAHVTSRAEADERAKYIAAESFRAKELH